MNDLQVIHLSVMTEGHPSQFPRRVLHAIQRNKKIGAYRDLPGIAPPAHLALKNTCARSWGVSLEAGNSPDTRDEGPPGQTLK